MARKLKIGDVVHLASGGPDFTIEGIGEDLVDLETRRSIPTASLVWFDTDEHGKWHGPLRTKLPLAALTYGERP